jgi:hypothetical protein
MIALTNLNDMMRGGIWRGTVPFASIPYDFVFYQAMYDRIKDNIIFIFTKSSGHGSPNDIRYVLISAYKFQDESFLKTMFTQNTIVATLFE